LVLSGLLFFHLKSRGERSKEGKGRMEVDSTNLIRLCSWDYNLLIVGRPISVWGRLSIFFKVANGNCNPLKIHSLRG